MGSSSNEYATEKSVPPSPPSHDGHYHDHGHGVVVDHGADSHLQRRLSSRHVTMMALGSSIGMGLWLGTGTSLADGGPAALVIGCKFNSKLVPRLCDKSQHLHRL